MPYECSPADESAGSTQTFGSPAANPRQFKKGQSGNPANRPRGARNKATLAIAALIDEAGPPLMRENIDGAVAPDHQQRVVVLIQLVPGEYPCQ
jgi:hypothetical protein